MTTLLAILKLLPAILGAIQSIEAAVPLAKTGPAKLDLLIGIISQAYDLEQQATALLPKDKFLAVMQSVTGKVVSFLNAVGIFHKSS